MARGNAADRPSSIAAHAGRAATVIRDSGGCLRRSPLPSTCVGTDLRSAWPRSADAEQIRAIYNHEVLHTAATFDLVPRSARRPGGVAARPAAARSRDRRRRPADRRRRGRLRRAVAVQGARRVSHQRGGLGVRRTATATAQGIGTLIVRELLVDRRHQRASTPCSPASTPAARASIALHRKCGFELVGIEREVGRKFNRWHDVALMQHLIA